MIGTVGALSAVAILADRSSLLSPSGQPPTLHRPAEPLPKLSASCLAPLLVNAEKSRRAIVRVARTTEPAKKEEEAEAADEERGGGGGEQVRGEVPEKHRGGPSIISGPCVRGTLRAPSRGSACSLVSRLSFTPYECVVSSVCGEVSCSAENPLSIRPRRAEEGRLHPVSRFIVKIPRVALALARISRSPCVRGEQLHRAG